MRFADHFSNQAADYARHRPHYPAALFEWLSSLPDRRERALDVACGSGQAAVPLCEYFPRVIGSEPSLAQLQYAETHPAIDYICSTAEQLPFADQQFELITSAQAVHWFDHSRFNREVERLLKPGGVLAVWGYGLFSIEPAIDQLIEHYYSETVGKYWPPERHWIEKGYAGLPFPFETFDTPGFKIEVEWNLPQVIRYLFTWSATQHYMAEHDDDPLLELEKRLAEHWRDPSQPKTIHWPIHLLAGRK
jgi:SAM-dependent methyltransferase